jgi:hypothetical protein
MINNVFYGTFDQPEPSSSDDGATIFNLVVHCLLFRHLAKYFSFFFSLLKSDQKYFFF